MCMYFAAVLLLGIVVSLTCTCSSQLGHQQHRKSAFLLSKSHLVYDISFSSIEIPNNLLYINKRREKIPVKSTYPYLYFNGLAKTREGYINRKGDLKIKIEKFSNHKNFSDGLAGVSKKNDYGVELWGFIDTAGKVKIPLEMRNEPGSFRNGLAITQPQNTDQYF